MDQFQLQLRGDPRLHPLKFASDMKVADIGAVMGRSEGAVKLLLHRGMIGVRRRLQVRPPVSSYSLR